MIATEPTTEDAVTRAQQDLERIRAVALRYGDEVVARLRDLETLKQDSGVRVFERALSGDGAGLAREAGAVAAALQFELETLGRAEEARIEAQARAIAGLRRAQADVKRAEAAEKRAEADRRQPKTDELLAQLREWEGVDYAPKPPRPPEGPSPSVRDGKTVATGGLSRIVMVPRPRTESLRGEAAVLEREAEAILSKMIVKAGHCQLRLAHPEVLERDADAIADEFVTLAVADPERVFPRTSEVRRTIVDVFSREQERRRKLTADHPHVGVPEVFELTWRDAQVVETRARLAVAHKVSVREGTTKVLSIDEWE